MTDTCSAVREAMPAHACSSTSALVPAESAWRPATMRSDAASMATRSAWRRGTARAVRVDLVEQRVDHGRRRGVGVGSVSHHQARPAHPVRHRPGRGAAPLGGVGEHVVAVEQRCRQGQLGDLADGEVHGRGASRYLRLPWLTTATRDPLLVSHSPKRRTALVAVSEWNVTISG